MPTVGIMHVFYSRPRKRSWGKRGRQKQYTFPVLSGKAFSPFDRMYPHILMWYRKSSYVHEWLSCFNSDSFPKISSSVEHWKQRARAATAGNDGKLFPCSIPLRFPVEIPQIRYNSICVRFRSLRYLRIRSPTIFLCVFRSSRSIPFSIHMFLFRSILSFLYRLSASCIFYRRPCRKLGKYRGGRSNIHSRYFPGKPFPLLTAAVADSKRTRQRRAGIFAPSGVTFPLLVFDSCPWCSGRAAPPRSVSP